MKIGKYISELLFENDFVILPDLGEFSTKYIPAKFIPELKKVESPSKVVTFNDKNKSGGGLLTEYIAIKEGIGSLQAKEFVKNFVAEMNNSLKSGKKVELEHIGVFSLGDGGSLVFEPDRSVNYLNDSIGMRSVKEPARKTEEEAKSELDKVLDDIDKDKAAEPEAPETPEKPMEEEQNTPGMATTQREEASAEKDKKEEPVAQDKKEESAEKVEPKKKEADPVEKKPPYARTRKPAEQVLRKERETTPKEKSSHESSKGGLPPAMKWVAFTVVPLLIIIIILAFNYQYIFGEKSVFIASDRAENEVVTADVPEPALEDPQDILPPAEEEIFDPTVAPPPPERGRNVFYIIVGSFEEEHKAVILAEELRREGARTADVFPINRLGFYRVSYGYYYDLNEAERDLDRAKQINENAWILHR